MKEVLYERRFQNFFTQFHQDHNSIDSLLLDSLEFYQKHPLFTEKKRSNSEEDFEKNYGNPLCCVVKNYTFFVLEKDEKKLSFKIFSGHFSRRVGKIWFKKDKYVEYLTLNLDTGDFYEGAITNYNKKRKARKRLRKNYFVSPTYSIFFQKLQRQFEDTIQTEYNSEILNLVRIISRELGQHTEINDPQNLDELVFKFYLQKKKFKFPNNFQIFRGIFYGPEFKKILKKNDGKVVDAFMIRHGLAGKILKKALHQIDHLNLECYSAMNKLFGNWLNQDFDFLKKIISSNRNAYFASPNIERFKELASLKEQRRAYDIFKKEFDDFSFGLPTIFDHISFYVYLKNFDENIKWLATTNEAFREEHFDWSEKVDFYKRGNYDRVYPTYFVEEINIPIETENSKYYPVILQNSSEYNNESMCQSNCVRTYMGKTSSIIISLRKDDVNSEDRLTLEYSVFLKNETPKCERIQSRGKYNSTPLESWNSVLNILDSKIIKLVNNKNFETVKLKKTCANGKELFSDSEFNSHGLLEWTYKIDNFDFLW